MRYLRRLSGLFVILVTLTVIGFAQKPLSQANNRIIADFEKRAKAYVTRREVYSRGLPKLPDKATSEQIQARKTALQQKILAARVNARQGNIFTQSATQLIRSIIKTEFKGYEGAEIRKTVLEADTTGIPVKVNVAYPESKELIEMSPALLLALPQLPRELRYRYVGRSLVILDRDNSLIIDFMKDALP